MVSGATKTSYKINGAAYSACIVIGITWYHQFDCSFRKIDDAAFASFLRQYTCAKEKTGLKCCISKPCVSIIDGYDRHHLKNELLPLLLFLLATAYFQLQPRDVTEESVMQAGITARPSE